MSKILKIKFYESEELTRILPVAIYTNVVSATDYDTREISKSSISNFLMYCNEFDFTKEEVQSELQNVLGEDYDLLMNNELDFIQVIY